MVLTSASTSLVYLNVGVLAVILGSCVPHHQISVKMVHVTAAAHVYRGIQIIRARAHVVSMVVIVNFRLVSK